MVGQFSRFVQPGAQRIASTTTSALDDVAFRNPDGSEVLVVDNTSSATQPFTVSWDGQSFSSTLPAGAVATYKWTPGGTGNTVSVTNPGNQGGTVGTAASVQVHASDSASGQTLAYSASGLPGGLSINSATGLISGTPAGQGTFTVTVTATDTAGVRVGHLHLDDRWHRRWVPVRLSPAGRSQQQGGRWTCPGTPPRAARRSTSGRATASPTSSSSSCRTLAATARCRRRTPETTSWSPAAPQPPAQPDIAQEPANGSPSGHVAAKQQSDGSVGVQELRQRPVPGRLRRGGGRRASSSTSGRARTPLAPTRTSIRNDDTKRMIMIGPDIPRKFTAATGGATCTT